MFVTEYGQPSLLRMDSVIHHVPAEKEEPVLKEAQYASDEVTTFTDTAGRASRRKSDASNERRMAACFDRISPILLEVFISSELT